MTMAMTKTEVPPMAKKPASKPSENRSFRMDLKLPQEEVYVSFQRIDPRDFSRSQKFGWQAITDSLVEAKAQLMDGTVVSRRSHAIKWVGEQMAKAMKYAP